MGYADLVSWEQRAKDYLSKEIAKTDVSQADEGFSDQVNTSIAIHERQEPTKNNTISDDNTYACNQTQVMSTPMYKKKIRKRKHMPKKQ